MIHPPHHLTVQRAAIRKVGRCSCGGWTFRSSSSETISVSFGAHVLLENGRAVSGKRQRGSVPAVSATLDVGNPRGVQVVDVLAGSAA